MIRDATPEPRGSGVVGAAVLIGGAAVVLYLATRQRGLENDGIHFVRMLDEGRDWMRHLLYLPAVRLVCAVLGLDAEAGMKALSAIAGGAAVALAVPIGRRLSLTTGRAATSATVLALLPGFWFHSTASEVHAFHAAATAVLLLGLLRWIDPSAPFRGVPWLLLLGAALVPMTHSSGIAAAAPVAVAAIAAPRGRRARGLVALGVGAAAFLVLFRIGYAAEEDVRRTVDTLRANSLERLRRIDRLPESAAVLADALLVHASPASVSAPAGLVVLWRRRRAAAATLLAWAVALSLLVFPIHDRAHGSYHLPLYVATAALALVAWPVLVRRPVDAFVVVAAGLAPVLLAPFGEGAQFAAGGASAAAFAWRAGRAGSGAGPPPVGAWPLVVAAALASVVRVGPEMRADPIRDRIAAVERAEADAAMILLLEPRLTDQLHWQRYHAGIAAGEAELVNLLRLEFLPPEAARKVRGDYEFVVARHVAEGRTVLLVGDVATFGVGPQVTAFLAELRARGGVEPVPTGIDDVRRFAD
ncbi:MAG: hypothetical protein ACF8XB_09930 [Planctomycetota bacterium JB042]